MPRGRQKDTVLRTVRESLASSPAAWASDTEGSSMTEKRFGQDAGKEDKGQGHAGQSSIDA